jgi:hypothetical protein
LAIANKSRQSDPIETLRLWESDHKKNATSSTGGCEGGVMKDAGNFKTSGSSKSVKKSGRHYRFFAFTLAASLSCTGWTTPSFGQAQPVTSPVLSPGVPSEIPDNVPADTELGIPLGSFRLYPTLDIRAGYDTNVFAQPAGQGTGSPYEAIRPSLEVRSDWNNHMLNFGAYGAFGFYNNATSQNYQNFGFNTDSRFDIQRDWYLSASAAFTGTTELLGTPDVAQSLSPSVVYAVPLSLSMYQRFNRLFYQATVNATGLRYSDFSQLNTSALPAGSRDRNEFGETLRAGYELYDGFDFWVQGGLNQRSYLQYTNVAGQQRDSSGWSVVGGSTLDLGGISKLEGFVGYTQQNYFNPGVATGAVTFGLGGTWNGYQPLVVRPFVSRSINETVFTNYQDYVSTTIGAELNYTLQNDWQLNGGASFSLLDYTPVPGSTGTFQHTDNFYRFSLGVLYSFRPQFQIGPLYEFGAGSGPDPNTSPNFTRHVIMLRFVAKQ